MREVIAEAPRAALDQPAVQSFRRTATTLSGLEPLLRGAVLVLLFLLLFLFGYSKHSLQRVQQVCHQQAHMAQRRHLPTALTQTRQNKKVPFSMAIGNGELVHECFPKHMRMGTARMK